MSIRSYLRRKVVWWFTRDLPLPDNETVYGKISLLSTHEAASLTSVFLRPFYWQLFQWIDQCPKLIVDCGADCGHFSILADQCCRTRFGDSTTRYVLVEPNPNLTSVCRKNLRNAGLLEQSEIIPALLGVGNQTGRFWIDPSNYMASGLVPRQRGYPTDVAGVVLQDRLPAGPIDILKVDIEGAEYALVENEPSLFANARWLILELHDDTAERQRAMLDRLHAMGMRGCASRHVMEPSASIFQKHFDGTATGMIAVVIRARTTRRGVIGGSSQSARNLLAGLTAIGADVGIVTWTVEPKARLGSLGPSVLQTPFPGEEEFLGSDSEASVNLPDQPEWRNAECIQLLKSLLAKLPREVQVIHLLETERFLGSWLQALKGTRFRVVYTALDYHWLCENSWLLTKRFACCTGPKSVKSCLSCYADHRQRSKRWIVRLLDWAASINPLRKVHDRIYQHAKVQERIQQRVLSLSEDMAVVDTLIAPSLALANVFRANGFPNQKLKRIRYGTPAGSVIPLAERPSTQSKIVFGFVGRSTYDKGFDLAVHAIQRLRKANLTCVLKAYTRPNRAGWDAELRHVVAHAEHDWIEFEQFEGTSSAAIDEAHREVHCLLAPSRWTDNLPNAVLEAFVRHTPVVAPRQGSFLEMVVEGDNGWFFDPANVSDLVEVLQKIVRHPETGLDLPFRNVANRLPPDEADDVLKVYEQLTATHAQPILVPYQI